MPLPNPRTGEAQNDFISRCMSNETIKKDFGKGSKQAQAVCFSQWRKSKETSQIQLNFKVPIEVVEQPTSGETGKDTEFLITGIAINSVVSDNKHKFVPEELENAAHTLGNVPLLKDHDNMVESIVGRVIDVEYVPAKENIRFKARINNTEAGKYVKELIKAGDLNTVSIGANVETLDEENGLFIPRGIIFKELSLVAVPADSGAKFTFTGNSFELALKEAYSQSQIDVVENNELNTQEKDMEDEQKKTEPEALEEESEKEEERVDETSEKLDALTKLVAESIADNKKVSERIVKLEEADKDEVPAEDVVDTEPEKEPEEEPEAEPEAEDEEEEEGEDESVDEKGYKIVQKHTSFSLVRNKY